MNFSKLLLPVAILLAGIVLRLFTYNSINRVLPLNGLYVDEKTYSMTPFIPGVEGLSRPPGMFAVASLFGTQRSPAITRVLISIVSLLPALALYLAFRKDGGILVYLASAALALSPFMAFFGIQILPAVPAAALIAFSLKTLKEGKTALAGFLFGIAVLFRAEFAVVPIFLLAFTLRSYFREWLKFTMFSMTAVLPVILFNLVSGAGPVIAANGGENLWLGTSWELLTTPPGTEFEELVSTEGSELEGNSVFTERAFNAITAAPFHWIGMGGSKLLAFFTLPGPGRNLETGWIIRKSMLFILLPLTLLALSAGSAGVFWKGKSFCQSAAAAVICGAIFSAFVFFPAARFRTAALPAFWFLAVSLASKPLFRKISLIPAAGIIIVSLTVTYPGMERSGLTSILAAEYLLDAGRLDESALYLEDALERGYSGADYYNVNAALLSLSGNAAGGLEDFARALEIAPDSPTLWKNYAVSLWLNGRYSLSIDAARRAVFLNPLLREQLLPILEHAENN
jgi:hypothetical protein